MYFNHMLITIRDGLSSDSGRNKERRKIWLLIRAATPRLQRINVNCVELLLWSQGSILTSLALIQTIFSLATL